MKLALSCTHDRSLWPASMLVGQSRTCGPSKSVRDDLGPVVSFETAWFVSPTYVHVFMGIVLNCWQSDIFHEVNVLGNGWRMLVDLCNVSSRDMFDLSEGVARVYVAVASVAGK